MDRGTERMAVLPAAAPLREINPVSRLSQRHEERCLRLLKLRRKVAARSGIGEQRRIFLLNFGEARQRLGRVFGALRTGRRRGSLLRRADSKLPWSSF
jgi:hypothetical protein